MRDIERMFKEKIRIVAPVGASRVAVMFASWKCVLKALVEQIRQQTVSVLAAQQLQADVHALRNEVSEAALDDADEKVLVYLLDEIVSAAQERCVDASPLLTVAELEKLTA